MDKCDQESAAYCKVKIAYNKYIGSKLCEECCDYCQYKEHCEDVCQAIREQNRNNVKIQLTFDFDSGTCGSDEINELLTSFESDVEKYLKGYFEGVRNIKIEEQEE